jgi:hypothetical protein
MGLAFGRCWGVAVGLGNLETGTCGLACTAGCGVKSAPLNGFNDPERVAKRPTASSETAVIVPIPKPSCRSRAPLPRHRYHAACAVPCSRSMGHSGRLFVDGVLGMLRGRVGGRGGRIAAGVPSAFHARGSLLARLVPGG